LKEPELAVKADSGQALTGGFVFARNSNLWLLSPDVTREKRLTYYSPFYEFATSPAWSPDGKAIAYAYSPKVAPEDLPYTDIWTVGPDGAGARKVVEHATPNESLDEPAWSADGRSLYVAVQTSLSDTQQVDPMGLSMESWRIDKVDLATGARTPWQKDARMPSAGADGREIAYIERVSAPNADLSTQGVDRLVLVGPGDAQPRVLVTEKAYQAIQAPQLSPDGKWVVFSAINVPPSGLQQLMPQGTTQQSGCDSRQEPGCFLLSAFRFLTFAPLTASAHGLPWDVFLVPAAGGNPIRLTQLNEDQPHAAWLDNSTIGLMGTTGLYKLSINAGGQPAGQPTRIHEGAPHGGLTWRKEGQK
jgi:WD40 repeat protein